MAEDAGQFIGSAEVAELLHVSTRSVQRAAHTGEIPVVQTVGTRLLFERAEIERLAEEREKALGPSGSE